MLTKLYEIYGEQVAGFPFVCAKGCSACCTRSVTMTGLEGGLVLEYLVENGINLPALSPGLGSRPGCTTNEFAARCLAQEESALEDDFWSFGSCLFLKDGACTIYPARPFGCRSFGSFVPCDEAGEAQIEPFLITLNTVVMQVIEHLDQGGVWGNLFDVLGFLAARKRGEKAEAKEFRQQLLTARSLPGFLVEPEEQAKIEFFLARLATAGVGLGLNV